LRQKEVTMRVLRVETDGVAPARLPAPDIAPAPDPLVDHPLVLVVWRDAWFDFDQKDEEESRSDYLVHTVGFLLSDGPRFVSLAQEVLPDGDGYRAVTHIPLAIVERLTYLEPEDEEPADAG
jgi:hypothetical protein